MAKELLESMISTLEAVHMSFLQTIAKMREK